MDNKIPIDELIEIFNNVLGSVRFQYVGVVKLFGAVDKPYKEDVYLKPYLNKKQREIENNLNVFENIPQADIYRIIEDFILILEEFLKHKVAQLPSSMFNHKKLYKQSSLLIKKDTNTIKRYQEMIFHYTSHYDWNMDEDMSILNPVLDDIYETNLLLLNELETKNFNILDEYRYNLPRLYDKVTKKLIKDFFANLRKKYNLKSTNIKEITDIL